VNEAPERELKLIEPLRLELELANLIATQNELIGFTDLNYQILPKIIFTDFSF
jgi:hypothetical protein